MSLFYTEYFDWLCDYAGLSESSDGYSYKSLADILHCRKFESLVPHDENRTADGAALREEFIEDKEIAFGDWFDEADRNFFDTSWCSILEMIVALAKRMDFEVYNPGTPTVRVPEFVHLLLANLGLDVFDDSSYTDYQEIGEILDNFIERTYDPSGEGGLFPLINPEEDQTKVEIWQQMMAYIREEGYI